MREHVRDQTAALGAGRAEDCKEWGGGGHGRALRVGWRWRIVSRALKIVREF